MLDVEVWVKVDADGDYAVGADADTCGEAFDSDVGGNGPSRMVRVVLHIPAPQAVEIEATVPDMVNVGSATVKG